MSEVHSTLPDDIKMLLAEAKRSFDHREAKWQPLWDNAWDFTMPERRRGDDKADPSDYFSRMHDSTGMQSARSLSNTLVAGLVPPWMQWFRLTPGALVPEKDREDMRMLLRDANQTLLLHLNQSNFIQEIQPAFSDLMVSTGAIRQDPADGVGVRFKNIPLDELALGEDTYHQINRIYHKQQIMARELLANKEWLAKFQRHPDIVERMEKRPDEMHTVWLIVDATDKRPRQLMVYAVQGDFLDPVRRFPEQKPDVSFAS